MVKKYLTRDCIRISSFVLSALFISLAISFLVLSFKSSDNEVLKLIGESPDGLTNSQVEKKVQYTFIAIAFAIVIVSSMGMSAAYSQEHCITYLVSTLVSINFV